MGRGIPVEISDVADYRKRSHGACNGLGRRVFNGASVACTCAQDRFMRANRDKVTVTSDGNVWWEAPSDGPITAAWAWFVAFARAFFGGRSGGDGPA